MWGGQIGNVQMLQGGYGMGMQGGGMPMQQQQQQQWGGWGSQGGAQQGGGMDSRDYGRPRGRPGGGKPRRPIGEPTNNIMVRNIPYAFRNEDLAELVQPFGAVRRSTVWVDPMTKRPRGFGLVEFETVEAAQAALVGLTGREVTGSRGNTLRLWAEYSYPKGDDRRPNAEGPAASEKTAIVHEIRAKLREKKEPEPFGLTSMPLDRLQQYLDFLRSGEADGSALGTGGASGSPKQASPKGSPKGAAGAN